MLKKVISKCFCGKIVETNIYSVYILPPQHSPLCEDCKKDLNDRSNKLNNYNNKIFAVIHPDVRGSGFGIINTERPTEMYYITIGSNVSGKKGVFCVKDYIDNFTKILPVNDSYIEKYVHKSLSYRDLIKNKKYEQLLIFLNRTVPIPN